MVPEKVVCEAHKVYNEFSHTLRKTLIQQSTRNITTYTSIPTAELLANLCMYDLTSYFLLHIMLPAGIR